MTSVESIGSNESFYPVEQENKVLNEETKAISSEPKSSGAEMDKLRAEETQIQAQLIARQERIERIKDVIISNPDFRYCSNYLSILERIATIDFFTAKEIIDSWDNDYAKNPAYLGIIKYANNREAAKLCNQMKSTNDFFINLKIYEEEKKKGFPEAKETFMKLADQLLRTRLSYLNRGVFSMVRFAHDYNHPKQHDLLTSLLNLIKNQGYFSTYSLSEYLEIMDQWPTELLGTILSAIREKINMFATERQIRAWAVLLEFEGARPDLQKEFQEDVANLIETIRGSTDEELDYDIRGLIKKLTPISHFHAAQFIEFLDQEDPEEILLANVGIFLSKAKDPEFDRKGEFQKLKETFEPLLTPANGKGHLALFQAAYAGLGEKESLPYFHKALYAYKWENPIEATIEGGKEVADALREKWKAFWGIQQEPITDPLEGTLFQGLEKWDLMDILKALTPLTLKEKQIAIDAAYRLMEEEKFYSWEMKALVRAELSLI